MKKGILLFCLAALGSRKEHFADLPTSVSIKILSIDLGTRSVSFVATQPTGGIRGEWSVASQNQTPGVFSDNTDPLANFVGDVFEHYVVRWTLSNGETEKHQEVDFTIGEGHSIYELSHAGVALAALVQHFPLADLIQYGFAPGDLLESGVALSDLLAAGIPVKTFLDFGKSPVEVYNAGGSVSGILEYDRQNIKKLMDANVSIEVLAEGGALLKEFKDLGVTDGQFESAEIIGTVADVEGNVYRWVQIGQQRWMAENLKTTRYADGSLLAPLSYGDSSLPDYGTMYTFGGAGNGNVSSSNPSGVQGVCPGDWHLPSAAEYNQLIRTVVAGTDESAGIKLRSNDKGLWYGGWDALNTSGFSALPGGSGIWNSNYSQLDLYGVTENEGFWTSEPQRVAPDGPQGPTVFFLNYDNSISLYFFDRSTVHVRCIRNN